MNELATKYNPADVEEKWYAYWLKNGLFKSKPDGREPYTVVIPPPNVTGILHMGHMLNNTIQDILVRRARMEGKNACWVPGTDHASIATEAKVVNKLAAQGIKKSDLSREEFLKYAWEWKEEHGGIILKQLQKLGASCDWDRTAFTMDEIRSESVLKVFVDLYNKGLIYRGVRMVNWDPKALTALSDEEVIYKDEHSKLYYLRYFIEDEDKYIIVATTRPETILGDTAVCVNPNDPRYSFLKGKKVIIPLVNRVVPIIMDDYVDIEFGTGCLKVTPAHDVNDYMLGEKYNLPSIDIFNDNGTISEAGGLYVGMDRFDVRKQIAKDLQEAGLLEKVEDYDNKVGYSERTNVVIEPKLSMQWFVKMDKLAAPALDAVMKDEIKFHPDKFKNIYRHWMENIKDWCISRQLWWGHRIPAYYLPQGGFVVAATPEEALKLAREKSGKADLQMSDLRQDEDCLDTWFSSWLWPISLFDGINNPGNEEINYYYPTTDLVTAPDIIFFWVARMIMAGYEYEHKLPFRNVYFTGIVRDKIGRKMSKSLGNVIDPNKVCDEMGADIIRLWVASVDTSSDVSIDHEILARTSDAYRRFRNTLRFLLSELEGQFEPETDGVAFADLLPLDKLMVARLTQVQAEVDDAYASYEFPRAYRALYDFVVTELSNVYLDALKDRLYCDKPGSLERRSAQTVLAELFSMLMRDLQPILSYTVDEAMAYAPAGCVDHQKYAALLDWYKSPITVDEANEFEGVLEASLELRSAVTKALEDARSAGTFTKSQQVRVKAVVPAEMYALLTGDKAVDLAEFYIVSDVELTQGEELSVAIEAAEGECCDRCWNYRTTVGEYNGHAHICKRCAEAL